MCASCGSFIIIVGVVAAIIVWISTQPPTADTPKRHAFHHGGTTRRRKLGLVWLVVLCFIKVKHGEWISVKSSSSSCSSNPINVVGFFFGCFYKFARLLIV